MKRCMYCGNENDDSSENCAKCGNRLLDLPPQQRMPAEEVPEEDKGVAEDSTKIIPNFQIPPEEPVPGPSDFRPDLQPQYQEQTGGQGETFRAENAYAPLPNHSMDVQRGRTYAAQQQYGGRPMYGQQDAFGQGTGFTYGVGSNGYPGQTEVQQQYGGQAYGYQKEPQQYGYAPQGAGERDYGRDSGQGYSYGGTQFLQKARKRIKSPLFFFIVLLNTVMVVASILNIVTSNGVNSINAIQAAVQNALGANVAVNFMNSMIDMVEGAGTVMLIVNLVLWVPSLLLCLGLWLMFLQTRRSGGAISTAGYTLTKVMVILKFVWMCLIMAVGLIISVAFVVAAVGSSSVTSIIVGVVMLIVMILLSSLMVLFYVQLLHCLKVMKMNAVSGTDVGRMSAFVPFVGVVLCLATVCTMLPMAPNDYLGLAVKAATAAWYLFASLWSIVYRATVK